MKYQSQGGPTLAECAALIRTKAVMGPKASQHFLDWIVYSALIGNADAHGKNLAILHGRQGELRLAPLYDLVPTIAFSAREIERTPALDIGNALRIDQIEAADWDVFAHQAGFAPRLVRRRVQKLAEQIIGVLPSVLSELEHEGADAALLERRAVQPIIGNSQRMLERLALR